MEGTREKALVGVFVLVAIAALFGVTLALTGGISASSVPHSTFFKFSGGLENGAPVRYGGLSIGKVTRVRVDPSDTSRIEIDFAVAPDAPVKTDSVARISSMGLLSDNFLELTPGAQSAPKAAPGSVVKSKESFGFDDIGDAVEAMLPDVQASLKSLNGDLGSLHTTIDEANDLLNEKNRANLAGTLSTLNSSLAELRPQLNKTLKSVDDLLADVQPKISATLTDLQTVITKLQPLLDNLDKTIDTANNTLGHVDDTLAENRPNIKASMESLRQVLDKATVTVGQLNSTLDRNSDNLDETLDNVRLSTENLRQLTDTLKASPSSIILGTRVKDRKPGGVSK
jgi:phospholipid/cholesterol/gamma-HCH transport system substrate-binding protein